MRRLISVTALLLVSTLIGYAQINIKGYYKPSYLISTEKGPYQYQQMQGIALDITYNLPISNRIPLNIEAGLGFHHMWYKTDFYTQMEALHPDSQLSNLYLPVRLSYNIPIAKKVVLAAYAGLYARYFLYYKKTLPSNDQQTPPTVIYPFQGERADQYLNQGQIGGQFGILLKANKHVVLELGYGIDFDYFIDLRKSNLPSAERFHTFTLGLGYSF